MRSHLLVALGGAIGAVSRFAIGGWIAYQLPGWTFPLSTFAVNVLGCGIAGALTGAAERWDVLSANMRLLLFTGILGGFTTFSAFGLIVESSRCQMTADGAQPIVFSDESRIFA